MVRYAFQGAVFKSTTVFPRGVPSYYAKWSQDLRNTHVLLYTHKKTLINQNIMSKWFVVEPFKVRAEEISSELSSEGLQG